MSENIENLVLEHLKRFQSGQDRIESKLEEIIHRLGHLEVGTSSTKRDIAGDKLVIHCLRWIKARIGGLFVCG
jgi:hypothetical protein